MRKKSAEKTDSWIGLQHWYQRRLGRLFGKAEADSLAGILPALFGYHIVALGSPTGCDLLAASPIAHRCCLDCVQPLAGMVVDVLAEPACLPIATDSVDVAVLPHVLEFVAEPHAVLREVDRILIPEGYAIILGFNPVSLWGGWRLLCTRGRKTPWDAHFLSVGRLRDWLAVLGFEIISVQYSFYRPPWERLLHRLAFLERLGPKYWPLGGGGYVLLAKKRLSTLTPVKPRWHSRQLPVAAGAVNRGIG